MQIEAYIINAFVNGSTGGNPAGVVLNADNLNPEQKLAIAKEVGLSETAFVSASSTADFKLDFFTPTRQIAHCGHATVAVFSYLAQTDVISDGWFAKETIDGNRKIRIDGEMAYIEQLAPNYTDIKKYHTAILDSVGIDKGQAVTTPALVNTGNAFVIIGLKDEQTLASIQPDFDAIHAISDDLDLIGYYLFSQNTSNANSDASSRMLAPRYGIQEEAATGMAAGPLACYLFDKMQIKKEQFYIEQGKLMQPASPSIIDVKLDIQNGNIQSLMAGGIARLMDKKNITL